MPEAAQRERTPNVETKLNTRGLIPDTAESAAVGSPQETEPPQCPPVPGQIDPGIRQAVKRLQDHGIETYESCEGGPGHSYPEPTIAFYGAPEAGWRAVAICLEYGNFRCSLYVGCGTCSNAMSQPARIGKFTFPVDEWR